MNKYRLREKEMTKLVYYFKLSYWSSKKQTKKLIISSSLHTLKFQQNSSSENVRSILKTTINITGTKQKVFFFLLNVILSLNQTKSIWFFFENDKSVLCKQLELPELESLKYTWYIIEPLFFFFLLHLLMRLFVNIDEE